MRRTDGAHLCTPGISLYAAAIAADAAASWQLTSPANGWWVNGWQRSPVIVSGDEHCLADHP